MTRRALADLGFLLAGIAGLASLVVLVPIIGFVDAARWLRVELRRRSEP
jgi:hypothetical protein